MMELIYKDLLAILFSLCPIFLSGHLNIFDALQSDAIKFWT